MVTDTDDNTVEFLGNSAPKMSVVELCGAPTVQSEPRFLMPRALESQASQRCDYVHQSHRTEDQAWQFV
jgi:hypothetical protein